MSSGRINSRANTQHFTFDGPDAGEGLAVYLSQNSGDKARYRFLVKAITDQGTFQVGEFFSSPPGIGAAAPTGAPTRAVGIAICPGAKSWAVDVACIPVAGASPAIPLDETATVTLSSSKCCSAPAGVSRPGERWAYAAASGNSTFTSIAGQRVTKITAYGLGGGGTVTIGGASTITVAAGATVVLEPKVPLAPNTAIVFVNCNSCTEFLESA